MRYLLSIASILISLSVSAQAGDGTRDGKQERQQQKVENKAQRQMENRAARKELVPNGLNRIKLIKTAYITAKLELTPDQSAKFWPLYNQYQEDMFAIQKQIRQNNSPLQTNGKDQVMNELSLDDKKISIRRHYQNEFLKIMTAEKLSLLYKSEKDFNDEAVKKLKESRNDATN
jgi:predicted 2-oxoglutarate/Fe(II)-dependent dioxygenase YbiX